MKDIEKGLQVQRTQLNDLELQKEAIDDAINDLKNEFKTQADSIKDANKELLELQRMLDDVKAKGLIIPNIDIEPSNNELNKTAHRIREIKSKPIYAEQWDKYNQSLDLYIEKHNIILTENPFTNLLSQSQQQAILQDIKNDYSYKLAKCDKYDYAIAAFCGIFTGLIDIFLVGSPTDSKLGKWTDEKVDGAVIQFSKLVFKHDKKSGANIRKEPNNIAAAIGYLERRFKVNYDARYASDLNLEGATLNMSAKNHHLKSLGHSPDIIGLFFSILDQFTGKASFVSDGKILRVEPVNDSFELRGTSLISKVFAGFANWFGHIMSDIAGSSGTRGHNDGRKGAGIAIPFYNLFQLCDFGNIEVNGIKKTIAQFSTSVYESGYDARFSIAMAIPVVINDLVIKLFWSIKQYFYHKKSLKESLPLGNQPELQRMLVVGHGTLCLMDGTDAAIRSNGEALLFATRLNLIAWVRFAFISLKEVRNVYLSATGSIDLKKLDKDLEEEWLLIKEEFNN